MPRVEVEDGERVRAAGLRVATIDRLRLLRRRRGKGFAYEDDCGKPLDASTLDRVRALRIPPAYTDVRIASDPRHHIQAVGRDEAGRLQYLYHPAWEDVREARKTDRLAVLCAALPSIRRRIARALRRPGADRRKALAAAVTLIDRTHIRVGCDDYVHSGRSRGAATLLKRNVGCDGDRVHLSFRGKRRLPVECDLRAPALARAIEDLRCIPGARLFQYRDPDGLVRRISASDVNTYLQELSGAGVTAKDFRTLAATAAAGELLSVVVPDRRVRHRRRQVAEVMRAVAALLGNTPAVVRKSYVHRRLVEAFESGALTRLAAAATPRPGLSRGEALVAALFPATAPQARGRKPGQPGHRPGTGIRLRR